MDFDEYDYLEKTVENPELPKEEPRAANGVRPEDRDQGKGSREGRPDDAERSFRHARSEDDRRRDSSRHSRDGERGEKERHRSGRERREREGSQKDREREKERDRERDRERIRERDREMEAERERERERARPVRGPRPERHHEERDRFGGRSKDVEFREREPKEKQSNGRRYKEKKEDGTEPEADPERDQRTVFAYQITLKADERDVYEFFSRAGKLSEGNTIVVRDVRLIMDRNSRRSKGVGYIEFYDVMSVPMAIALSGQKLLGQAVMVKPSEAEKNLVQSNTAAASGPGGLIGPYSGGVRRLYVGNLHLSITEEQLRQVFEPFGLVELVQLPREPGSQQCKGYGFVQFARLEDARAAQNLNGQLEIAGRTIKVSAVADQVGMQDIGTNAGDFDDDEGGGLGLDARSRALLMQKLDRSGITTSVASAPVANSPVLSTPAASVLGAPPVVAAPAQPSVPGLLGLPGSSLPVAAAAVPQVDSIGVPSECLLLKNMFDPSLETEPDFDFDIKEDVQDECSKFGTLKHIFVDKNSTGFVYLRFDNATSAISAQRALHGRWFAGKMITATFMLPQNYIAKFPESA